MFTDIFLHALTSYFVVIDPIGTALIFHGLTTGCERSYAKRMALRSTLIAAAIVLVSAFFGQALLTKLGISIEALRVSGGLLLFITAFNMVTKGETGKKWESGEEVDISVFPMSIPLLSGPGCPVCVTPTVWIDRAIAYAQRADCIITTFGDMLRVPGSDSSLEQAHARAPGAGAAAYVEVADGFLRELMEAMIKWIEQSNQQVKWKHLTFVGMAG